MSAVRILAWNTLQENLRSRYFAVCMVFAAVLLYSSLLLGLLAADQELRVLLDFGLSLIELLGLAVTVYAAATTVLREIETKTIYLILTRPIGRPTYLAGRFAGLMLSTAAAAAVMAGAHLVILFWKGWAWTPDYAAALLAIYLKLLAAGAVTLFLALFSSSVLTAMTLAAILWTLGHVLPEIRFLIQRSAGPALSAPLMALSYVVPDLQLLNLRDRVGGASALPMAAAYAAAYATVWLALAAAKLKRKEF